VTTRLDLLCSASTAGLRAAAFSTDEPLDLKGRAALARLDGRFRGYDAIFRSPALSAAETAQGLRLQATPDPALRDCDFGRWAGRALAEVEALEPQALALWLSDPQAAPHGGESFAEATSRVAEWMDALPAGSGAILAITHAAVLRAAIVHALGAPALSLLHIDAAPLGRVRLSGGKGSWRFSGLTPAEARF
jgi:broad specificity phosphatase PhoE